MSTEPSFEPEITAFMLVKTTAEWLDMSIEQRLEAFKANVRPAILAQGGDIRLRFYDTEFFSARVTDIWMWEARTNNAYQLLVEALRETPFWARYFDVVEILVGVENGYAKNYNIDMMA